jgi:hypothetical protein
MGHMTESELIKGLDKLQATMISVSTGGAQIGSVNSEFIYLFDEVDAELIARGIEERLPYRSLWDWHGRWSQDDLKTYRSRRSFVGDLFTPLIRRIRDKPGQQYEPTGWERVDRTVSEMKSRLASAKTEEQFQNVGLLGRELLISTAQQVFNEDKHPTLDGVAVSSTDAKRMLERYIAVALGGGTNEHVRKHAKAALELAVHLQHKRTATFREAAICVEATTSVVSLIAIMAGLRDPPN